MESGYNLVKQNIVGSIDVLVSFLLEYKLGIFDLYHESEVNGKKVMDIRIYECIDCAQLPNMGNSFCFFESGLIIGIFKELNKKEVIQKSSGVGVKATLSVTLN